MEKNKDLGLLILRLGVGILMLLHGIAKLKGISFVEGALVQAGLPSFFAYGVYITEIVAPILLIIGYRTRLASVVFFLGALMAVFLVHSEDISQFAPSGAWKIEVLGLYMTGALALFFMGSGKFALSHKHTWD